MSIALLAGLHDGALHGAQHAQQDGHSPQLGKRTSPNQLQYACA